MILRGDFPKLILKTLKNGEIILRNEEKSNLERLIFEPLLNYPYIITIQPVQEDSKRILYSTLGNASIFTFYLGHDIDCTISLDRLNSYKKALVKDMQIEHAASPEKLKERHFERIENKYLFYRKDIVENAYHEYSKLIRALEDDF